MRSRFRDASPKEIAERKNAPKIELGKWYRLKNSVRGMTGLGQSMSYERGELVFTARFDDETSDGVWVATQRHICGGHLEYIALVLAKPYDLESIQDVSIS